MPKRVEIPSILLLKMMVYAFQINIINPVRQIIYPVCFSISVTMNIPKGMQLKNKHFMFGAFISDTE
jgi:hypothetical protein